MAITGWREGVQEGCLLLINHLSSCILQRQRGVQAEVQSPAIVNFPEITASPNFLEYSLENVATLMKIDRELFGGGSEKEIFKAVIKWI